MPSCDDDLVAESDDKDKENIKIESLRILKTIGTGRNVCLDLLSFCMIICIYLHKQQLDSLNFQK